MWVHTIKTALRLAAAIRNSITILSRDAKVLNQKFETKHQ